MFDGTTFEVGTSFVFRNDKLEEATLSKDQYILDKHSHAAFFPNVMKSGTVLKFEEEKMKEIVVYESHYFYDVEIPKKSRIRISRMKGHIDDKPFENNWIVIWTSHPFQIKDRNFPSGTSIELKSKDEVYVYIPPKMLQERVIGQK